MRSLGIDIGGTSAKLALLDGDETLWTGQSAFYARPDDAAIVDALRDAATGHEIGAIGRVGICVPGLLDEAKTRVTLSVNVPGLMARPIAAFVRAAFGDGVPEPRVQNDAISCATDVVRALNLAGRVLVLALGTGVGAAVLDDGVPLRVDGDSPGHLGQIDVSLDDHAPIGPDGGAGSLEGYLGVPAIRRDYGDVNAAIERWTDRDPPLRALARTIRIAHAMYRPNHIVLAGGVGVRLRAKLDVIRSLVNDRLTRVARSDWTLASALDDFHAARGAARLASQ